MFDNIQPITVSPRALQEVRKIMETKNIPADYGLRVGIKGGGCGGVSLMLGFDKKKQTDLSYDVEGIPVYIDKKHTMYLIGKQVDFAETDEGSGFMFIDPSVPSTPVNDQ
jgi:iron-sulfur cluster assembly protein